MANHTVKLELDEWDLKENAKARVDDPEGSICFFCGEENDMADDIGWWYPFAKDGEQHSCCRKCWNEQGFEHWGER